MSSLSLLPPEPPPRPRPPPPKPLDGILGDGPTARRRVLLAATVLLLLADLFSRVGWILSSLWTVLQTVLTLVWAWYLIGRDVFESEGKNSGRASRTRAALGLTLVALSIATLIAKVLLITGLRAHGAAVLAPSYRAYTVVWGSVLAAGTMDRRGGLARILDLAAEHPARLMLLSFGLTGLLGGFLLSLPQAVRDVSRLSMVDGVFTSFSAVCVTGLVANDFSAVYSPFGQLVVLVLIQIGGLGITVLSAAFAIVAGQKMGIRSTSVLAQLVDVDSIARVRRTVLNIVRFTLACELAGAILLYLRFRTYPGIALPLSSGSPLAGAGSPLFAAVFQSVGAFNNAGFPQFRDALIPLRGDTLVVTTIMVLITIGGIGYPVFAELAAWVGERLKRRRPRRLSLHVRVVLLLSAVFTFGYAALLLLTEWSRSMRGLPMKERLLASLFQSVVSRTAGFNVVDLARFAPVSLAVGCVVMFVGAAPGSTSGGVKLTTIAALFAELRAELRGEAAPRLFDRELPAGVVRRATAVLLVSAMVITAVACLLLALEQRDSLALVFDTVSAYTTTGLSTGITPSLRPVSKLLLAFTMFLGRIGPLTLVVALADRARRRPYELPEEKLLIG